MLISIACSAGSKTGYGHLTRSLSLAKELATRGNQVCFHPRIENSLIINDLFRSAGIINVCNCNGLPRLTIVDSYDSGILEHEAGKNSKIVALVDELSPPIFADAYIEASPILNWKPLNRQAKIKHFNCDPILREQIKEMSKKPFTFIPYMNIQILLILGSSESIFKKLPNLVKSIRNSLPNSEISILSNDEDATSFFEINELKVVKPQAQMLNLLKRFDLVISAAGVTAWELIILGQPCLLFSTTANQNYQLEFLTKNHLAIKWDISEEKSGITKSFTDGLQDLAHMSVEIDYKGKLMPMNGTVNSVTWLYENGFII